MAQLDLTEETFQDTIADGVTLVDFWAPWCAPCRALLPELDRVCEQRPDLTVGKVNVDDAGSVAERYGVQSIPTLIVFCDGQPVKQLVGRQKAAAIIDAVDSAGSGK